MADWCICIGDIYDDEQRELAHRLVPDPSLERWKDYRWQLRHRITTLERFEEVTGIDFGDERERFQQVIARFPLSITPYYLSLINTESFRTDPVFLQAFGSVHELDVRETDHRDPLAEETDSPVPGITHRYPDRVLFLVSNTCSMYCRHCTRKRTVGDEDSIPGSDAIAAGLDYIREHEEVRDVLLSGGDPLMLGDARLDSILSELDAIPHVEIKRLGTRMPVVLPYRITDELVAMLAEHQPLYVNTHFNHPREITASSRESLAKLADAGLPLGNQSVLLAGVNDCPRIITALSHRLLENRVRPYYLYQCDLSEGLAHFRTPISKGIEIMEHMIGHTTGFARPQYVVDAPGGGGKIPVNPQTIVTMSPGKVVLRNFEGVSTVYHEPESYPLDVCDRRCDACHLDLDLAPGDEYRATGIAGLLSDDELSLTPQTDRAERRPGDRKGSR